MPSPAQVSTYKLIRSLWPQTSIYDELFESSPTLGLFKKDTNFVEQIRYIGVGFAAPQGVSPDFPTAKQFKSPSKATEFQISTVPYYGAFSINGDLLRKSKYGGNKALIVDPMKRDSKNLMRQIKNDLSTYIHGNGGGSLGRLTSGTTVTTNTGSLQLGADRRRIEPGMALWSSPNDGTSGVVNTGYVTVNSLTGTDTAPAFVVDQASLQAGIGNVLASDFLFRAGVYGNIIDGLDSWNPDWSGGNASTFRSVNRSIYNERLAGYLLDGTKMTPRQRVLRAARIVADAGGKADTYLMSTRGWENLYNDFAAAGSLRFTKVPAAKIGSMSLGVSYDAIDFIGPTGRIEIFADPFMPDNVERCIDRGVYTIGSVGELVHWDDDVGPDSPMVEESADAREVRVVGDMAFYTEAPAFSCRVKVTA